MDPAKARDVCVDRLVLGRRSRRSTLGWQVIEGHRPPSGVEDASDVLLGEYDRLRLVWGSPRPPGVLGERLGVKRLAALPLATYRSRGVRSLWLDTFDRLTASVDHHCTWDQVRPWYEQHSLEVLSVRQDADLPGLTILARSPAR